MSFKSIIRIICHAASYWGNITYSEGKYKPVTISCSVISYGSILYSGVQKEEELHVRLTDSLTKQVG